MKIMTSILAMAGLLITAGWTVSQLVDETHNRSIMTMTTTATKNESFPACTFNETSLNADQRDRHKIVMQQVMREIQEIKELPNGYSLRLPLKPIMIRAAAEFMSLEQKCCSFFGFNLEIEPNNGPLWLSITGGAGTKEFLRAELGMK